MSDQSTVNEVNVVSDDDEGDLTGFSEESFQINFSQRPSFESPGSFSQTLSVTPILDTLNRVKELGVQADLNAKQFLKTVFGVDKSNVYEDSFGLVDRQQLSPARAPRFGANPIGLPSQQPVLADVNCTDTSSRASWYAFHANEYDITLMSPISPEFRPTNVLAISSPIPCELLSTKEYPVKDHFEESPKESMDRRSSDLSSFTNLSALHRPCNQWTLPSFFDYIKASNTLDFEIPYTLIVKQKGLSHCKNCKLFFRRLAGLNSHIKQNPRCRENGLPKIPAKKQVINKKAENKYICSICDKKCSTRSQLRTHSNIHLRQKEYVI